MSPESRQSSLEMARLLIVPQPAPRGVRRKRAAGVQRCFRMTSVLRSSEPASSELSRSTAIWIRCGCFPASDFIQRRRRRLIPRCPHSAVTTRTRGVPASSPTALQHRSGLMVTVLRSSNGSR